MTNVITQKHFKLLVCNASQIVQVTSNHEKFVQGKDMDNISIIKNGSMVVDHNGKIVAIDSYDKIEKEYLNNNNKYKFDKILDCKFKKSIVPGLCDAHTHPVWTGDRVNEFNMKLKGATYLDIHKKGGGIGYTVKCVREENNEKELLNLFIQRLNRMLKQGTTLLEAKSGYGLNLSSEVKMLKIIQTANYLHPIDIVANYCGAHSILKDETTIPKATKDIIENQIPEIIKLKKQGLINPEMIDVFHEKGIFEYEETKEILKAGKEAGLLINFHGDELHANKSAELAASLNATSVSHLECISDEGIKEISKKKVIAVLLPTTAHILQIEFPPARKMISNNVIIALGSDFNPNAHCLSMPFTMNLACITMRLTLNEALTAATINSAAALGKSNDYGSLEINKYADFIIIDHIDWQHLIYELVDPPIYQIYKKGNCVVNQQRLTTTPKISKL